MKIPSLLKWYLIIGAGVAAFGAYRGYKGQQASDPAAYTTYLSLIVLWPVAIWIELKNRNAE